MGKAVPKKKIARKSAAPPKAHRPAPRKKSAGKSGLKAKIKVNPKAKAKTAARPKTRRPAPTPPPAYSVHPTAIVDPGVTIGEGTRVWHFSHVQSGARIGKSCVLGQNVNVGNNVEIGNFVKIQNNVSVYEGVILEDYAFCGPSMVFTNVPVPRGKYPQVGAAFYKPTIVREGASLGANSTIVCGHAIGRYAFVGAGAVVTKDVPDYALVVGNPARLAGWMSEAGEKLHFNAEGFAVCPRSGRKYRLENGSVRDVTEEG